MYADWPARERPIKSASPRALRGIEFEPGSMAPKVAAACQFVKQTGGVAQIGALEDARAILADEAGTTLRPGTAPLEVAVPTAGPEPGRTSHGLA